MTGPFAQAADDFIQYKRSCGFKYEYEPKCLSRFCRFATDKGVTFGYAAYILPEQHGTNTCSFVPYIFTHEQINALIRAADATQPWEGSRNMHLALPVIFRILYGCGLRVSEVCNLKFQDVNLDAGILTIHEPKNGCDRYIPLSDSIKESIKRSSRVPHP